MRGFVMVCFVLVNVIEFVWFVSLDHDGVIKWKQFPRLWSFVRGIHQWPVENPHKGQWREGVMFFLICAWKYGCEINRDVGDWRCHCAHYDVTVMILVVVAVKWSERYGFTHWTIYECICNLTLKYSNHIKFKCLVHFVWNHSRVNAFRIH